MDINPSDMIIDDSQRGIFRVNRRNMTSPEILQLERDRIFNKSWLYVGHDSEIPNPGDFRRRNMGGRSVMFVRGNDGQARVFLNTCAHRGSLICRQDEGNGKTFECFYHGWTYNNDGELVSVPEEEGYSDAFDKRERSLASPPRHESYRNFHFLSFDPYVADLVTYLADVRLFIDLVANRGETGMKILHGSLKYTIKTNWKLLMENSLDAYHLGTTHATFLNYVSSLGRPMTYDLTRSWGLDLGNGHSAFGAAQRSNNFDSFWGAALSRFDASAQALSEKVRSRIIKRYGDRWDDWSPDSLTNFSIYPNLICVGGETWRTMWPVAPDQVEVQTWVVMPLEAEGEDLARRINNYPIFQGPGGFATPDDVEALESCQVGIQAGGVEWSDISRGMHRVPQWDDELQMRAFWRQWLAQVQGLPTAERWDDWASLQELTTATGRAS